MSKKIDLDKLTLHEWATKNEICILVTLGKAKVEAVEEKPAEPENK